MAFQGEASNLTATGGPITAKAQVGRPLEDPIAASAATEVAPIGNATPASESTAKESMSWMAYFKVIAKEIWNIAKNPIFPSPAPQALQNFDINSYMGTWHEIATSMSVRATFEYKCSHTNATYRLVTPAGGVPYVEVKNCALRKVSAETMKRVEIIGKAYPATPYVEGSTTRLEAAKLEVMFYGAMEPPSAACQGNYWVIAMLGGGSEVVVSGPSSSSSPLWVLSRNCAISDEAFGDCIAAATAAGIPEYRLKYPLFIKTDQSELSSDVQINES